MPMTEAGAFRATDDGFRAAHAAGRGWHDTTEACLHALGDVVSPGQRIMFCRRDHDAAVVDLERMLADVKRRAGRPPRAGVYYACVARGPHLFGPDSEELRLIRDALGEFPLVGFFANGEISHDRLYGYTGVLALFL